VPKFDGVSNLLQNRAQYFLVAWVVLTRWRQNADVFRLTSPAFEHGQEMAQECGKRAQNVSPPLAWEGAPEGTKSFALALVDRHPVAGNYVHWLVVDMDPQRNSLQKGAATGSGMTEAKQLEPYVGPFPPSGTHDYEFTLYALNTETLDLRSSASLEDFSRAAEANSLAKSTLVGKFTRIG
jgi:Raf kinase inhibitor-like YbhB/YbcL family protein